MCDRQAGLLCASRAKVALDLGDPQRAEGWIHRSGPEIFGEISDIETGNLSCRNSKSNTIPTMAITSKKIQTVGLYIQIIRLFIHKLSPCLPYLSMNLPWPGWILPRNWDSNQFQWVIP
jgi:hypothetical protein